MTKLITKEGRKWMCRWYVDDYYGRRMLFKTTEHKTKREAQTLSKPPETKHTLS
jgi:hypothetical protein